MKAKYELIDGIPIWVHLKNGASADFVADLTAGDMGTIAERIGKRILSQSLKDKYFLKIFFPTINVLSTKEIRIHGYGDYLVEVSYEDSNGYGKKMLLFEIKHGKVHISQQQIKKYSSLLLNPDQYFRKADEIKVIYMIFEMIDTVNKKVHYYFSELNKDFGKLIFDRLPVKS